MTSIFRRKGRRGVTLKWQDASGRWRMKSFKTRTAAQDEVDRLKAAGGAGDITVKEYAAIWLARADQHFRPTTAAHYRYMVERHIVGRLGDLELGKVDRARIKDFIAELLASKLKKGTVANIKSRLHSILEEAVEDGRLAHNPAAGTRLSARLATAPTADTEEHSKALDAAQLAALFAAADGMLRPAHALLFRTMALTGLRLGEASALQWEDLDLANRQVLVRRTWAAGATYPTKTKRQRAVDLARGLADALQVWSATVKTSALQRGETRAPWVFPGQDGRPISSKRLEEVFKAALKAAELPPYFTPHGLRHSYASLMLTRGVSMYYVQRQLGHASIRLTTDLYGRWLPAGNPAAVDGLEAALSPRLSPSATETGHATKKRAR